VLYTKKGGQKFWYPNSMEVVRNVEHPFEGVVVATEAGPPPDDWRLGEREEGTA
jgi:hypothetical protein